MTPYRAITLAVLLAGFAISQAAPAQWTSEDSSWPGFGVGVKVGTLGLGGDVSLPIIPDRLNMRMSGNYLDFSYDGTADDIDYEFTLDFKDLMLLGDWHPFANNFRVSGGVVWHDGSKVKLMGTPTDNVTIGDHEYTPEQIGTLNGELAFENAAPYVGIGFGNAIGPYEQTWSFVFDLGVIFQTFDATLTADGPAASIPQFQADLKKEEEDLQDDLESFEIYPVLQFGVAYHF
jgi:hypothetical protein